ncbi:MAG: hypothetical protein IKY82_02195 [Alistipes sp.]|nr:hypothetical protein [Alistipes sp.]
MQRLIYILMFGALLFTAGVESAYGQELKFKGSKMRRLDREIQSGSTFGYRGEWMTGLTASYGTLTSEDSQFWMYLDNINVEGAITTVKPFFGYFYRDNRCVGLRLGYQYIDGNLGSMALDLGEQNDISLSIAGMQFDSNNFSTALFHRSYFAIDPKGQFGVFAEVEAAAQFGSSNFANNSGAESKFSKSDNLKLSLGFNPGVAVYIFPSVCATISVGLGGVRYTHITQYDADGVKTGARTASKMQFRINLADIHFGMVVHLWNKKKMELAR